MNVYQNTTDLITVLIDNDNGTDYDKKSYCDPNQSLGFFSYGYVDSSIVYDYNSGLMTHLYPNGRTRYKGEWSENQPNGRGIMYDENGTILYDGSWKNGVITIDKLNTYNYSIDMRDVMYLNGKKKYHGGWKNGVPNGEGVYYDEDGNELYTGTWDNGIIRVNHDFLFDYCSGEYIMRFDNSDMVENQYLINTDVAVSISGKGSQYYPNGMIKFKGEWMNGKRHGYGYEYDEFGNPVYEGQWKNDLPHGRGCYYENGKKRFKGRWINGYHHLFGASRFCYSNRKVEKWWPVRKKHKKNEKSYSIETVNSPCLSGVLVYSLYVFLFLVLVAIFIVLLHCRILFSKEVTLKAKYQYYLIRSNVEVLTFSDAWKTRGHWGDTLEIKGLRKLKELHMESRCFKNTKQLVMEGLYNDD